MKKASDRQHEREGTEYKYIKFLEKNRCNEVPWEYENVDEDIRWDLKLNGARTQVRQKTWCVQYCPVSEYEVCSINLPVILHVIKINLEMKIGDMSRSVINTEGYDHNYLYFHNIHNFNVVFEIINYCYSSFVIVLTLLLCIFFESS